MFSLLSELQSVNQEKHTARIFRASKTRDQSRVVSLKALHGIFLTTRPSRRTVVIGPYNRSADEVNRSIAYT
jgi:diphthamide synthase subunit DPH2